VKTNEPSEAFALGIAGLKTVTPTLMVGGLRRAEERASDAIRSGDFRCASSVGADPFICPRCVLYRACGSVWISATHTIVRVDIAWGPGPLG
jgi:hypothetical protein